MKNTRYIIYVCLVLAIVTGCSANSIQPSGNSGVPANTGNPVSQDPVTTPKPTEGDTSKGDATVTEAWKQNYLELLVTTQDYIAHFDWSVSDDYDSHYPRYTTDFRLADLNFDGIPELIVCGESVLASSDIRIYTMTENGMQKIFSGLLHTGSGPTLFHNPEINKRFYAFTCLEVFSDNYLEHVFTVYMTDEETALASNLKDTAGLVAVYLEDYSENQIFMFNGRILGEQEYSHLVDSLFEGLVEFSGYPVSIKDIHPDEYRDNDYIYSESEILQFFELFKPETTIKQ